MDETDPTTPTLPVILQTLWDEDPRRSGHSLRLDTGTQDPEELISFVSGPSGLRVYSSSLGQGSPMSLDTSHPMRNSLRLIQSLQTPVTDPEEVGCCV